MVNMILTSIHRKKKKKSSNVNSSEYPKRFAVVLMQQTTLAQNRLKSRKNELKDLTKGPQY